MLKRLLASFLLCTLVACGTATRPVETANPEPTKQSNECPVGVTEDQLKGMSESQDFDVVYLNGAQIEEAIKVYNEAGKKDGTPPLSRDQVERAFVATKDGV